MTVPENNPAGGERVAVVGMGYVGLPLAVHFAEHYPTVGYDRSPQRIAHLSREYGSKAPVFSSELDSIRDANSYVIVVPTPLSNNSPDLGMLKNACENVGRLLKRGDMVVIESTVYPGATEEVCIPILEQQSGLSAKEDEFHCGYSPERVRPASRWSDPRKIVKLTSGYTPQALARVDRLYQSIITAGTQQVSSIKIAEMSKLVENVQRDVDVALSNEIAMACNALGISTREVLDAADSKWNFRRFNPGLVGGHCISVDPIYLSHRLRGLGNTPRLLEEARRVNDSVPAYLCQQAVTLLTAAGVKTKGARVLILGYSFKENIDDCRNTLVAPIVDALEQQGCRVTICDPLCDPALIKKRHDDAEIETDAGRALGKRPDLVMFAVAHDAFKTITPRQLEKAVVMDVKHCAPQADWYF